MNYKLPAICARFLLRMNPCLCLCVFLCLYLCLSVSCNPERDNPYDPQSPDYRGEGTIRGRVTTVTGTPIHSARVSTIPLPPKIGGTTLTDSNGTFTLYPDTGICKLVAEVTGYLPETTEVYITIDTILERSGNPDVIVSGKDISFYLDGIPVIQKAYAISCHEDKGYPIWDVYWVDVWSKISDPDGIQDIDSVRLSIKLDTKEINVYLSPKSDSYFVNIPQDSCPASNMENLIGKAFVVYAIDKKGVASISCNFYVPRFIYSLPIPIKDSVSQDSIKFIWHRIKVDFPVIYKLTIQDYTSLDTAFVKDSIADTTAVMGILPSNKYLWTVEGRDEFGDIGRSDKVSFSVN